MKWSINVLTVTLAVVLVIFLYVYNSNTELIAYDSGATPVNITSNELNGSHIILNESDNITSIGSDIIPNEEYEVFSTVIREDYPESATQLTIKEFTSKNFGVLNSNDNSSVSIFRYFENMTQVELNAAMVNDFKNKNSKTYKLDNKFSFHQNVVFIPWPDICCPDEAFYKEYPGSKGLVEISRAGFNNNRTQAILYYGKMSGKLAGGGNLYSLAKEEGKWKVIHVVKIWVS